MSLDIMNRRSSPTWWTDRLWGHRVLDRLPPTCEVQVVGPRYGTHAQWTEAWNFLRRHHNRRYSDRTLMALVRAADRAKDYNADVEHPYQPGFFSVTQEVDYDDRTEVKTGGTLGVCVVLPAEDGARLAVAVHQDYRRKTIGRLLVEFAKLLATDAYPVSLWSGRQALEAGQFALSAGFTPNVITPSGSMQYIYPASPLTNYEEDENLF